MATTLRVLVVRQWLETVEPVLVALRRGGFEVGSQWEQVDSEATLRAALERGGWQVVIYDPSSGLAFETVDAAVHAWSPEVAVVVLQVLDDLPFRVARAVASGRASVEG